MYEPYIPYTRRKATPRTRSWVQRTIVNGGAPTLTARSHDYLEDDMLGVDIPNFWKRKEAGELLPHTNFLRTKQSHTIAPAKYSQEYNGSTIDLEEYSYLHAKGWMLPGVIHAADTSNTEALVQQAAANIAQKGWDGLTFASELPSLNRMFSKTARRMKRLHERKYNVRDWKRGTKQRHGKPKEFDFGNLWLEGRYGWRTLAYDMRDLNDAITDWDSNRKIWTERSGTSYSESSDVYGIENWSAGQFTVSGQDSTEHSVRGAVAALYIPARVSVDPVQTAWELLPYSFVVDWFVNVGNALAAAKLQLLAKGTTASFGVKSVTTRTIEVSCAPNPGWKMTYTETYRGVVERFKRVPTQIPLAPTLKGTPLNPSQLTDLGELLRGKKRPLRR